MRILNGKDYYDNGMSMGQDNDLIFVRSPNGEISYSLPEKSKLRHRLTKYKKKNNIPDQSFYEAKYAPSCFSVFTTKSMRYRYFYCDYSEFKDNKNNEVYLSNIAVFFCGKIYYGVEVHIANKKSGIFYHAQDVLDFLLHNDVDYNNIVSSQYSRNKFHEDSEYVKHFPKVLNDACEVRDVADGDLYDWIKENKVSIITYGSSDTMKKDVFHVNDTNLTSMEFYRVFDAYSAYQELSMWLGSGIFNNSHPMIKLDDKELTQKHGFDKWSFRKMPEPK